MDGPHFDVALLFWAIAIPNSDAMDEHLPGTVTKWLVTSADDPTPASSKGLLSKCYVGLSTIPSTSIYVTGAATSTSVAVRFDMSRSSCTWPLYLADLEQ